MRESLDCLTKKKQMSKNWTSVFKIQYIAEVRRGARGEEKARRKCID